MLAIAACSIASRGTDPQIATNQLDGAWTFSPYSPPRKGQPPQAAFVPTAEGFVSTNSAYRVTIRKNLRAQDAVTVEEPSGQRLRLAPAALSYYSPETGTNALVAELQDCAPVQIKADEIAFPGAWDDAPGVAIVYKIGKFRFSQNLYVSSAAALPAPADWGTAVVGAQTRLQLWTEVFEAPSPQREIKWLRAPDGASNPGWWDETLTFERAGKMRPGHAFVEVGPNRLTVLPANPLARDGSNALAIPPVAKTWQERTNADGSIRRFLIEDVEWESLKPLLEQLPKPEVKEGAAIQPKTKVHRLASRAPLVPGALPRENRTTRLAARPPDARVSRRP